MKHGTITTNDGRTIGFCDYGRPDQTALLYCHGGPGNRFEPAFIADSAARAGIRLIGVDRPGYGLSTAQPGRTIGGWVPDALAVLDHLGIARFLVVGMSTGGAYALALASQSSRVVGAVACGAVSDMAWAEGKAMNVSCQAMWNARSRDEATDIATDLFGAHGEIVLPPRGPVAADPSDAALMASPEFLSWWVRLIPEAFAQGPIGIVDDRLADAHGWASFDVAKITCPVVLVHGSADGLMPAANARHTAAIVPGATLRIFADLGHLSILTKVIEVTSDLLVRCLATR